MRAETELSRIFLVDEKTNACDGDVCWNPTKSLWVITHFLLAIIGGALTFSVSAVLIFLFTTAATLCLGHSLGMHRRLIHNSYDCPRWLEYFFVHLGVLVGLAGSLGMMKTHDLRDWAQRQNDCHTYLRHGETFWKDAWWQLHCDLNLKHPPEFKPEPRAANDRVLNMMEQTWMLQQLPLAILLFALG
jgi:fatty-acid desaturase